MGQTFELTQVRASEAGRLKERLKLVKECAWIWVTKLRKCSLVLPLKKTYKISRDIFVCSPWWFVNCGSFLFLYFLFFRDNEACSGEIFKKRM